jgi:sec-independent protein translocase protein TatB
MFEVGFWELVLVVVVALLVVGPERLPKMAYEVGLWYGRLQRYARNARFQIENELHNYEIKNSLQQPTRMLEEIKSEIDAATHDPWRSASFTGELPKTLTGTDVAGAEAPTGEANNVPANAPADTGSAADDGQSKPKT